MNKFYVIIENNGEFEPYDILPYLSREWDDLKPKDREKAKIDLKSWVDRRLMYQYWARCQYEIILSSWPSGPKDKSKKIDVYWQAVPNLELITKLFAENEGIS